MNFLANKINTKLNLVALLFTKVKNLKEKTSKKTDKPKKANTGQSKATHGPKAKAKQQQEKQANLREQHKATHGA